MTRRAFLAAAGLTAAGIGTYSATHARHEFFINQLELPIRNLPDAFVGFHIVQISDIHLQGFTEPWFLERILASVNNLNPDLVLITGDYISRGPHPEKHAWRSAGLCSEILSTLKAPQRFGILGNHDVAVGAGHVIEAIEAHGTPILVDSYFALERGSDRLWLAGSDDASTRIPDLDLAIPQDPRAPVILMAHEPDFVDHIVKHPTFKKIDVVLSGHTHGGQVRLPFVGPLILPPLGKNYVEGMFHFDHMKLYVNRGIGTVGLPFRLNCPAEITSFILSRA
ncbi:MAG: metallophosphoesterase [Acidobacteriaceae bacterium]|nr:metallophosphoesterase [Acidobacteriaceae bacterium]